MGDMKGMRYKTAPSPRSFELQYCLSLLPIVELFLLATLSEHNIKFMSGLFPKEEVNGKESNLFLLSHDNNVGIIFMHLSM